MIDDHQEELHNRALSLSTSSKAGVVDYLACYQRALKSLLNSLSEEDKSKYRVQAKTLTNANPLPQYVLAHHLPRQVTKYGKQRMMEQYVHVHFRNLLGMYPSNLGHMSPYMLGTMILKVKLP